MKERHVHLAYMYYRMFFVQHFSSVGFQLTWTGVRCAIPSHLKIRSYEVNMDHVRSLQFNFGDKTFNPALSKSRDFYGLLISCKATESRGFTTLKSKISIDDIETKKTFSLIRICICETYVQCFQFKKLSPLTLNA